MLKEGVRLDRVRGGRQKYRRVTPYATPATSSSGATGAVSAPLGVANSASNGSAASPDAPLNAPAPKKWSIEGNAIFSIMLILSREKTLEALIIYSRKRVKSAK